MKFENNFGDILKGYRKQAHVTQDKLAELVNMDRTYISMLERGVRYPSLDTAMKLSHALNLKCSDWISILEIKCHHGTISQPATHNAQHSGNQL